MAIANQKLPSRLLFASLHSPTFCPIHVRPMRITHPKWRTHTHFAPTLYEEATAITNIVTQ